MITDEIATTEKMNRLAELVAHLTLCDPATAVAAVHTPASGFGPLEQLEIVAHALVTVRRARRRAATACDWSTEFSSGL